MKYTKEKKRNFKCPTCKKSFLSGNDLRKHSYTHTDERPHACTKCNQRFRQAVSLKNHVASTHGEFDESSVYICNYCNKVFPVKERLKLHMRVHTGVKPYKCEFCEKLFARGGQLKQHVRTHTGDKPYECTICNSTFTCSANLKLHLKRHLDVRDYICDVCGKAFYRRDALRKHLSCFHGNVKPFHCDICDKDFKGHLSQHLRIHTNDKPHGCAICGARFAQRSQLTVHQRVHSGEKPYRCKVCWKAFAHSTALKLHTRQHTGEKPFACVLCKKMTFTQLPHLKKHMLCVHKSDKPYVCEHCHEFFKLKSEITEHYTKCTKIEKEKKKEETEPAMALDKMRFLLAILLKKISSPEKLKQLGFDKTLIDDVLIKSIQSSQRVPCTDDTIPIAERLKKNVQILLEWTVPKHYMKGFKSQQRSTEELLEELTA